MTAIRLALVLACLSSITAAAEKVEKLDRFEVRESPLGIWGIGYWHRTSLLNKLTGNGQPSNSPYMVWFVHSGSPADRAGVRVGDEIQAVQGRGFAKLPVKEFEDAFRESVSGERLSLSLTHPVTHVRRETTLTLDSGRKWRAESRTELNFWDVKVVFDEPVRLRISPRFDWPTHAFTLDWSGKQVTLVEHPGDGVELIVGSFSPRKYRKAVRPNPAGPASPPMSPQGRLVPPGAVLELLPNGTYKLSETPMGAAPTVATR